MNDNNPLPAALQRPRLEIQTGSTALKIIDTCKDAVGLYLQSPGSLSPATPLDTPLLGLCTPELSHASSLALAAPFRGSSQGSQAISYATQGSAAGIHAIRTASHDQLLHNELYRYILAKNSELNQTVAALNRDVGELQGKYDEQRMVYDALIGRLPLAISRADGKAPDIEGQTQDANPPAAPRAEDYPLCKFWTREKWTPYMQTGDLYHLRNINNVRRYLEDSNAKSLGEVPRRRPHATQVDPG
ncbi:hypothetical protein NUW54_g118 [Trametes sanguinea]|uniref:Uncharacterized protein n=1 Tax=Trametes sanguinea TaxID=158606 RepID=A0ACC1QA46_9APHY|nr:hypothetical protein NUW54_g118 [Trametes sanguinea]